MKSHDHIYEVESIMIFDTFFKYLKLDFDVYPFFQMSITKNFLKKVCDIQSRLSMKICSIDLDT